ncbi:MAG TPA: HAD-IIB family hydrolase, partial [Dongiaceae bacterium]|nr:HAD-IIB family hydrolase [Dongiaceae bacterium]
MTLHRRLFKYDPMVNFDGDPRGERRRRLAGIPAALWRWVVQARHRLLMLDYDGTLAPFAVARADARPSPETIALLQRIAASPGTTLAIVSGRRLDEIEALMADVPATLIGEHGWERRRADGTYLRIPLDPATAATLAAAVQAARAGGWGERL